MTGFRFFLQADEFPLKPANRASRDIPKLVGGIVGYAVNPRKYNDEKIDLQKNLPRSVDEDNYPPLLLEYSLKKSKDMSWEKAVDCFHRAYGVAPNFIMFKENKIPHCFELNAAGAKLQSLSLDRTLQASERPRELLTREKYNIWNLYAASIGETLPDWSECANTLCCVNFESVDLKNKIRRQLYNRLSWQVDKALAYAFWNFHEVDLPSWTYYDYTTSEELYAHLCLNRLRPKCPKTRLSDREFHRWFVTFSEEFLDWMPTDI